MNAFRLFIISAVVLMSATFVVPLPAEALCSVGIEENLCPMSCFQGLSGYDGSTVDLSAQVGSGGGEWTVWVSSMWPTGSAASNQLYQNASLTRNDIALVAGNNDFVTECWSEIGEYELRSETVPSGPLLSPTPEPTPEPTPTTKWVNVVVNVQDTSGNAINGGSWSVSCPDTNQNSECPLSGTSSYASNQGDLAGQGDYTLSAGSGNGYTLQSVSPGATQTRGSAEGTVTLSWTLTYAPNTTVDIQCNNANSCSIQNGASATLSWSASNASSCTASGAWSGSKPTSGSESTGALTSTRTYTLTCNGVADSVTVTVAANSAPTVSSVRLTEPDYCALGPGGIVSWTFNDAGDTQSAYQVQVDDNSGFTSVNHDSGQVSSSATSYSIPQGQLAFNRTYYARVRTWDAGGLVSSYANMSLCTGPGCAANQQSWSSPQHQYPSSATFTATPQTPRINQNVAFASQAVCYNGGGNPQACASWTWNFGDGTGAGPGANLGNTSHAYSAEGTYTATMQVTDNEGYTCPAAPASQNITVETLPLPKWKEVLPQ
ncbi:MAG: PKD domain-containing protein [Candidatus Paceibacterota bacterium]|nr:MAG: PKD domain-containing protein [Candidatus Paceibacterota bacterium]